MRSLQVKIAAILIVSIVAVVFVATGVTAFVMSQGDEQRMVEPMARHIAVTQDFYLAQTTGRPRPPPREPRSMIVDALPSGDSRDDLTAALRRELAHIGATGEAVVQQSAAGEEPVAALRLADGRWMLFPFPEPMPPPPGLWVALASWLTIVVVGVVAVALIMARRVTRPFAILENAVASVGPDGVLPHTPETGSGEARQTAVALNALSDRLRAAMESRMRLVAAAGHDLRTPMTRMRLRAEFLPDEERDSWLSDLDELEDIADSAIRLVREEGAGEDRRPVTLDELVRETVSELVEAQLRVALGETVPANVTAGPMALKRALRNLITNAATHGGGASVRLEANDNTASVIIEDQGPGIPQTMLAQVFEPFFRANPGRNQEIKGAGLGLAIAKEIIERFGGRIEISNRSEGGLCQIVALPRALAPGGVHSQKGSRQRSLPLEALSRE